MTLRERKVDPNFTALFRLGIKLNCTAHLFDQFLSDNQSNTAAILIPYLSDTYSRDKNYRGEKCAPHNG